MVRRTAFLFLVLASVAALGGCQISKRVVPADQRTALPMPVISKVPVIVRVALAVEVSDQALSCTRPSTLSAGMNDLALLGLAAGETLVVRGSKGRVVGGRMTPPEQGRQFEKLVQGGPGSFFILAPVNPGDFVFWGGRPWRGALRIEPSAPGSSRLTIVNEIDLEDYLAGVVPMEMGRDRPSDELAALAAQAVAARTYALARLGERRRQAFDLYADVRDQVYGGVAVEDAVCNLAVAMTAGLVLRRGPGLPLADTFYHSTCGGHTTASVEVWPVAKDPLLSGVGDQRRDGQSWCAESPYFTWHERWSWAELEQVLARTLPAYLDYVSKPARAAWAGKAFQPARSGIDGREPGVLKDLRVVSRTAEGRVAVLEITTEAGRYRVRGDQTRRVLQPATGTPPILRSAWFELNVSKGHTVHAAGRGWGHGIGMCQMGALGRARSGHGFDAILAHYYPGSVLALMDAEVLP